AGLSMLVDAPYRLPQLNTVLVPDGIDEAAVRAHVLKTWDLELGAGLGPLKGKVWRIGLMGASATPWHVRLCLTALCEALVAGIEAAGLKLLVAPAHRLPQLNAVLVPDGVDEAAVRAHVLKHWDLEIGAGLGPLKGKVWRIGLMGASATAWHVRLCLTALGEALAAQGHRFDTTAALAAADGVLAA
ncbi:MAG TPA: hypothetical protein VGN89_06970, partial [Phenylobacterium sp.]|nr:hypothetical protein [Phenylobacterium sp.]